MFFTFKGFVRKPQKRPNTEPQGVPEADDGLSGKLIQFSTISVKNNENQQQIHTHIRKSTKIEEISENQRKSMNINEHQRKS